MNPVCETRQGAVRGCLDEASGVASFLGIPYARPPFGERRFREPVPAEAWDGVRDAFAYGPTVPKAPYAPPFDVLIPEDFIEGEDCLNLNVWTPHPAPAPDGGLPVMVWLHGGAFSNGSGSATAYSGSAFARDGVVCVTVNYRLGVDGFLHLDGVPDNRGLLDQIAALEWVRDNIAAFGGDPDRVTVFGESAGAMAIGVLLGMERARGLFRRAVLQSGGAHHFLRPASARMVTARLAEQLGIEATAAAFADVPMDELIAAQAMLRVDLAVRPDPAVWGDAALNAMPFEPVTDGLVLPGPDCGVELLVGSNREENRLFLVPTERLDAITEERVQLGASVYGLDPEKGPAAYRAAREDATPGEVLEAVGTDWFYRIPAIRLAESVPGSHVYEFAWCSPQFGGRLGACHASELAFVFDNLADPGYAAMIGDRAPQALADAVHGAWVAFATTGDPGWEPYDTATRTTMVFGDGAVLAAPESDPRAAERQLWDGVR
ncbi:carboxylesterase/lipase family protein [Streptomyces sp. NBC_01465]|uniref:carboxylesterase/lipase family protein n=1 Tax=Streptomyces sp. NBC_01465 TaxID=2903878 RepID=UPI002E345E71|nr:carboxylesterase family protein [Streptomyces sp. NBC_01465]